MTKDEHTRLSTAKGFGWERYRSADITVVDTAAGMGRLDLAAAAAEQRARLDALQESFPSV